MKIRTNDGYEFQGTDAKDVVRQMKYDEWSAPERKREYMEEVVDRVSQMVEIEPVDPQTISAEEFLVWLERAGLVKQVDG